MMKLHVILYAPSNSFIDFKFLGGPNDEKWHFEWILIDKNLFINDVIQSIRAKWAQENNNQANIFFFFSSLSYTFAPIIFQITKIILHFVLYISYSLRYCVRNIFFQANKRKMCLMYFVWKFKQKCWFDCT